MKKLHFMFFQLMRMTLFARILRRIELAIPNPSTIYSRSSYWVCLLIQSYRLKSEYCQANERIGKTGAGLSIEDVTQGSKLWNIIGEVNCQGDVPLKHKLEQEKENFPWWEFLHGFWRTLPNFNPFTAGHGQDIAEDAEQRLFKEMKKSDGSEDFNMPSPEPIELEPSSVGNMTRLSCMRSIAIRQR